MAYIILSLPQTTASTARAVTELRLSPQYLSVVTVPPVGPVLQTDDEPVMPT